MRRFDGRMRECLCYVLHKQHFFHKATRQFAAGRRQADSIVSMWLERFFSESSQQFRLRRVFVSPGLGMVLVRVWELAR